MNTTPLLFAVCLILLAFSAVSLIGWGLRRSTLSIDDMREASERIAQGDYDVQVTVHGPQEIRSVAIAFNSMASQLKQHEESRQELLADITHELRTPLAVIQGNLEGMLDRIYLPDETHLLNTLEETHHLSRLIEDLHLLSLLDSGALKLNREPTDMLALAHETTRAFQPQAKREGFTIEIINGEDLPNAEIDPVRVREILSNLIVNALRHMDPGGCVRIRLTEMEDVYIHIEVEDNGSGIPAEELAFVFDRFRKSPDSKGSGLGLSIVKSLVEAHGGEIEITSKLNQGTIVSFTLPLAPRLE